MKDSTILGLSSVAFNVLAIWAVIINAPTSGCAALALFGAGLLGLAFYNLANDN
jgi:hypothetical protein